MTPARQTQAKLLSICAFVCLVVSAAAGPSSRPGWCAIPYFGATNGTTFRVWAPNASSVTVKGTFNGFSNTANPLFSEGNGAWSVDVPNALPGHLYKYRINGTTDKKDPRGRRQESSVGNNYIYNTTNFNWAGDTFAYVPINDAVLYELNIATFNDTGSGPGTFLTATNRLPFLKELGVSAVEVMPINEFPGDYSWGYNPSDIFGVESAYGGPDAFKSFVKACHQLGIGVVLDVVHNHYGPTDLDLWRFDGSYIDPYGGIYFYQQAGYCCTPYGNTRPNYSTPQVRDFIRDNFLMWLNEYRVDGFRWDSPGYMMNSDAGFITDAQTLIQDISTLIHTGYVGKLNIGEDQGWLSGTAGFDSVWANGPFQGNIVPQLTAANDADRNMSAIETAVKLNTPGGAGYGGWRNVLFMESHDSAGDLNGGQRLPVLIDSGNPTGYFARKRSTLGAALTLTTPGIPMILQGQEMLTTNQFGADEAEALDWSRTNTFSGIVALYRDLIRLRRNLDGLSSGLKGWNVSTLAFDNTLKLYAYYRWDTGAAGDDVVVIANFANATRSNYNINFPKSGTWYVHFNSDSTKYSPDYGNIGSSNVVATGGSNTGAVTIGPYSVLILSQVPAPPPVANFTASPTNGLAPLTVTFTNTSTGNITNQLWSFGDGGTSAALNPGHTYTNAGSFTVALTVFGPGGTNTLVRPNMITIPSVALATWTNANASGNWSAATSWNPVSVPDAGASVIFGAAGATSVVDNTSRTINTITFNRAGNFSVAASGGATLTVTGGVTVAGNFTYSISAPVILGAANTWSVTNGGTLSVSVPVNGTNSLTKTGAGALILAGTNTYSGSTLLNSGTLAVVGAGLITNTPLITVAGGATFDVSGRTGGSMTLMTGQTLSGNGTVRGTLVFAGGSTLSPGSSVGTLTVANDLVLSNAATLQYDLGTNSDLVSVAGNLTLAGTLNLTDAGGFGVGSYTLFTYGGTLTVNGVTIGTVPNTNLAYTIDTSAAGQVKLNVQTAPAILNIEAAILQDAAGNPAPTSAVAVLVADTTGNGFTAPQSNFALSLGAAWGADDRVVGLWDLRHSFACIGDNGALCEQTTVALANGIAPGQRVQLYWFPSLTLAAGTLGITSYGKYSDTNNPTLDASDPWQIPAGGATVTLRFYTAAIGGSNPDTAGRATLTTTAGTTPFEDWQAQYFGSTNNPAAAPGADPDGDGQNNLAEFLAGTVPTNSASSFCIQSIVPEAGDLRITWTMGPGRTNALQFSPGVAGGYSTNFSDIFVVTNTVGTLTNFLHLGAATNSAAGYYRVRIVP